MYVCVILNKKSNHIKIEVFTYFRTRAKTLEWMYISMCICMQLILDNVQIENNKISDTNVLAFVLIANYKE